MIIKHVLSDDELIPFLIYNRYKKFITRTNHQILNNIFFFFFQLLLIVFFLYFITIPSNYVESVYFKLNSETFIFILRFLVTDFES